MAKNRIPTFAVGTYKSILPSINSGVLQYPSYVFCTDTNTLVFVDKNKELQNLKGYNQDSILVVDNLPTDNIRNDVFYVCDGIGYFYINNVAVPMFKDLESSSYNDLKDIPIVNQFGETSNPLVLADLKDGVYSISGTYQVGGSISTVFVTSKKTIFIIDSDDTNKYITKFSANNVLLYTIDNETGEGTTTAYATESWIKEQGYTTENYVNEAINAMYQKIIAEVSITKISQLENDVGYLTKDDVNGISDDYIASLF